MRSPKTKHIAGVGLSLSGYQSRIAVASLIGMTVSVSPILFSSFPVLLEPVTQEFGWGRSEMSLGLMAATTAATMLYPFVGRALDRWGSRAVLLPGFAIFGLAIAALSFINGSKALLLVLFALAGATSTLATGVAFARAISRVFFARRGLMLGFCLGAGGGIGAAIIPILTHILIGQYGWRGAYLGLALLPLLIGVPIIFHLLREPPERSDDARLEPFGPPPAVAMRSHELWLLLLSIFLSCGVIAGVQAHFVAIAGDRTIDPAWAASMLSISAIATMAGQLLIGVALDHIPKPVLIRPIYAAVLVGVALIHFSESGVGLLAGIALIGFAAGSEYGLLPYYLTRLFGIRSFGQLYGMVYAAAAIANGIGPVVMGAAYDITGSYRVALIGFELCLAAAILATLAIRRFRFKPDGSDAD